jgi:hypothetical protein
MRPPARRPRPWAPGVVIALAAFATVAGSPSWRDDASAAPTTTAAATTTAAPTTTTATTTTVGVTTTTEAGPPPRGSRRVAAPVDTEKIRPTSLPWQTIAIGTAVIIAALAIAGFIFGRLRSRTPAVATARPLTVPPTGPPTTDPTPADTTTPLTRPPPIQLPPPEPSPLPPPEPASEWAPPTP